MDSYGQESEYAPTSKKLYFISRKNEILECMKQVKDRVKSVEKSNS